MRSEIRAVIGCVLSNFKLPLNVFDVVEGFFEFDGVGARDSSGAIAVAEQLQVFKPHVAAFEEEGIAFVAVPFFTR